MRNAITSIAILIAFVICSCKEDEMVITNAPYYFYIPSDTGRWILYDVDSTYYYDFQNPSIIYHYTFQVIERIDSKYIDNEGRETLRLQRAKRDSAGAPWINYTQIWTSNLSSARYEKMEENVRFVKLGFPIAFGKTWDGNAYNTLGKREYYYETIHEPLPLASFNFDSTITVFQGYPANVIENKNGKEIFANHVGMVYKKYNEIEFDSIPNHLGGVTYSYTINSYGLNNAPMFIQR